MSVSDDVGNLFRRFGGDAGQYQEVTRDDDAKHAALRWPLLNALDIAHPEPVPDASRPAPKTASAARVEPTAQTAMQAAPAPAAQPAATPDATGPSRPPLFARGHRHASMPPPVTPAAPMGASRFSPPPAVAPAADRVTAAANAPTMSAASVAPVAPTAQTAPAASAPPAADMPTSVAPATTVVQTPSAPLASSAPREALPQRPRQVTQAAPFLADRQTFARTPFSQPVTERPSAMPSARPATSAQQGGSILSGLFGGGNAARGQASGTAPSKDLSSLFARLSHGAAAPSRSLRDAFRPRFKADGDA
ncbi:cellulose biosynthesis protein BcsP [Paraburkholderia sp. C35]|uniref:cellulose biosynthesis protein BcsP n=1 Tax=Paraburkholderia sp. C35 TaxID=2126993 RepID=UPI000D697C72|nr:cellulose biosynthesis protein BcsP [Paraburkholderia sp. C35]